MPVYFKNPRFMKKFIPLLFILSIIFSCKSMLYNYALKKIGVYDEKIKLESVNTEDKKIVFFPIHHVGTEKFYTDVQNKTDSLKNLGYYFYYERIDVSAKEYLVLRKWRKIHGIPIPKEGYKESFDSIVKIKLKKKIVNQPSYTKLGLDSLNSKNVDARLIEVLNYYEKKYGEVKLEPCDFETTIHEKTICENDNTIKGNVKKDVMIDFRNNIVIKELLKEKKSKIAIIYGKGHLEGLKEELLKYGYK